MRSPEELQQERIDEVQKEKMLRKRIERLTISLRERNYELGHYKAENERLIDEFNEMRDLSAGKDQRIEQLEARNRKLEDRWGLADKKKLDAQARIAELEALDRQNNSDMLDKMKRIERLKTGLKRIVSMKSTIDTWPLANVAQETLDGEQEQGHDR